MEDQGKKPVKSINKKSSNAMRVTRSKINDNREKNIDQKFVNEKPSNLVVNWEKKLIPYE